MVALLICLLKKDAETQASNCIRCRTPKLSSTPLNTCRPSINAAGVRTLGVVLQEKNPILYGSRTLEEPDWRYMKHEMGDMCGGILLQPMVSHRLQQPKGAGTVVYTDHKNPHYVNVTCNSSKRRLAEQHGTFLVRMICCIHFIACGCREK